MRYYLIAGEASGDLHGAMLIRALKAQDPGAEFRFRGGDLMAAEAGSPPVAHYRDGAFMGFSDVLAKAPEILGALSACKRDIDSWHPDAVIPVDYPGFNLNIAKYCHSKGYKVFYYIAPKTWASREGRNAVLAGCVDLLFLIFPFEEEYFRAKGVPVCYVGNPLVDEIAAHSFSRPCEEPYIAVLPGSRRDEIRRTMPVSMEVADELGCKVLVAAAPSARVEDFDEWTSSRPGVKVLSGRTLDILKYAGAAIVNSGTASLEAVLTGTPQLVCYSGSAFNWWFATRVLQVGKHIRYISLGNLCLGQEAVRELLQDNFNKASVLAEVRRLLEDSGYRAGMLSAYEEITRSLGEGGAAGRAAARIIRETGAKR